MNEAQLRAQRLALGAIAVLIPLLMMPNLILLWFEHGIEVWIDALFLSSILLLALFAVFGNRLWLACLLLAPFAMLAPLEAFYIAYYHYPTSAEIFATIVATNPREMREYLGEALVPLALSAIAGLLVAALATRWSHRAQLRWRHSSRSLVLVFAIVVPLTACITAFVGATGGAAARMHQASGKLTSLADMIGPGYPFGMFQRMAEYRREWVEMRDGMARLDAFRFHAHRVGNIGRRQVYVLVVGEASRRDHWQLFGYERTTNPKLTRIGNLVPMPDMVSSWPESLTAIPMVLTRKPATNKALGWNEPSILRAMQEAGFETWWISNQLPMGVYDSPVAIYAFEAQHAEFLNHAWWYAPGSYDESVLSPLRSALNDSNRDLFIVLHLMGSHQAYDFRYPDAYRRFRPTLSDPAGEGTHLERARNSYDNTILYTDDVLASIIGILRKSDAVTALWYVSDHGEALQTPTCSLEGHGYGTRFEFEISALSWYSDAYASAFPERVAALRENAGKRTMSADTFESVVDMAGVDFPGHDPSWSVFSPNWRYQPRIVNDMWQHDIDRAAFDKGCSIVMPR
jgi:glucan phosphoethanolaminetransferase (alkaline phosphatase superfamily)